SPISRGSVTGTGATYSTSIFPSRGFLPAAAAGVALHARTMAARAGTIFLTVVFCMPPRCTVAPPAAFAAAAPVVGRSLYSRKPAGTLALRDAWTVCIYSRGVEWRNVPTPPHPHRHPHPRRPPEQPEEPRPRPAAGRTDGDHRRIGLRQVLAGLRHAVCRGPASLRGNLQSLCAPVPRPH